MQLLHYKVFLKETLLPLIIPCISHIQSIQNLLLMGIIDLALLYINIYYEYLT